MKPFKQFIIYDRGTPDLEVYLSIASKPLKHEPHPPRVILSWETPAADYWAAYWVKRGVTAMTDDDIKRFCEAGFLLK